MGELCNVDKDWVPRGEGYSLYLRPTGISTHVRAAAHTSSLHRVPLRA